MTFWIVYVNAYNGLQRRAEIDISSWEAMMECLEGEAIRNMGRIAFKPMHDCPSWPEGELLTVTI